MKLFTLFFTFFKIGLFTFGGGYGMIPLVQQETVSHGWLDEATLLQYIGICESTPGPIAVNMATFVGSSQAGFVGSLCCTLGVVLPAFLIMLLIASVFSGFRKNPYVDAAMSGIRPAVAGLITATGAAIALKCLFANLPDLSRAVPDPGQWLVALLLAAGLFVYCRILKKKFSPILLILYAAACGIAVYGILG